jgi:hypothetical protein
MALPQDSRTRRPIAGLTAMYIGTYERLGVNVYASNRDVIRAASRKLRPEIRFVRKHRRTRHAFYREMIACHRAALELVVRFRL